MDHEDRCCLIYQINDYRRSSPFYLYFTERDPPHTYSGVGHAGVGGSIAFLHRPTGLCIAVMLNKADVGQEVTMRIFRVIGDHFEI